MIENAPIARPHPDSRFVSPCQPGAINAPLASRGTLMNHHESSLVAHTPRCPAPSPLKRPEYDVQAVIVAFEGCLGGNTRDAIAAIAILKLVTGVRCPATLAELRRCVPPRMLRDARVRKVIWP